METKIIYHPTKKHIIEERDYKLFGLLLEEVRRYFYDDQDRLVELSYFDKKDQWTFTKKYYYNKKGQRFAETSKSKNSEKETRNFHLFDVSNKIIATYGELESGHQYCHEFGYDTNGKQVLISMDSLRRDIDLADLYKNHLKQVEEKSKLKSSIGNIGNSQLDVRWNCDICDGNEMIGCQYFDPTECPRHS